jgi:flagellar biosynthetic protein FlhB
VWTLEGITPKLSKISPIAGLGRLFSKQALANFGKGIAKLVIVGTVLAVLMWPERTHMEALVTLDPIALLPFVARLALKIMGAVVAAADYLFQYRQWHERQKMSLREVKEEYKQNEGDPTIKGKLKQLRNAKMKKRMIANVPKAAVIITNPTHYAVACNTSAAWRRRSASPRASTRWR